MAALAAQSQPGKSPGQTYTSILGQAVAAKTPAKMPAWPLRRVSSIARPHQPRQALLPHGELPLLHPCQRRGEWTRKESGPLSNPALEFPTRRRRPRRLPSAACRQPRHLQPAADHRQRLLAGGWPASIRNVGFSRDMKWTCQSATIRHHLGWKVRMRRRRARRASAPSSMPRAPRRRKRRRATSRSAKTRSASARRRSVAKSKSQGEAGEARSQAWRQWIGLECRGRRRQLAARTPLAWTHARRRADRQVPTLPRLRMRPARIHHPAHRNAGRPIGGRGCDQVEQMKGGTLGAPGAAPKRPPQLFYLAADRVRYQFERS